MHLASSGDVIQALDLARAWLEKSPSNAVLKNAFAFFSIPLEPGHALRLLEEAPVIALDPLINIVNKAAGLLACKAFERCEELLRDLASQIDGSESGWFWSPRTLIGNDTIRAEHSTIQAWVADALSVVDSAL